MAEIEIRHEHAHGDDPLAKRVGLMVGLVGLALAAVTIAAHREHTAAVLERTEANDRWAYYQAKKIREHTSDVAAQLALALAADPEKVGPAVARFESSRAKYASDAESIKSEAEAKDRATEHSEQLALRFDLGEGFTELGLVLSSLYFLGRRRVFPVAGGIAAMLGALIAASVLVA
ncbi:MAG TPA: DUF4337 family protein [Steroidobacteraceae bacterium]|nr:DUF4337 family protein [Steroidobacteraceae bacterium]